VEEFRKKWNCNVICSTHRNYFSRDNIGDWKFVIPGTVVHELYASFGIGWYYNQDGNVDRFLNPI